MFYDCAVQLIEKKQSVSVATVVQHLEPIYRRVYRGFGKKAFSANQPVRSKPHLGVVSTVNGGGFGVVGKSSRRGR